MTAAAVVTTTQRCLTYLDSEELKAAGGSEQSTADAIEDSLQQTLEMLAEWVRASTIWNRPARKRPRKIESGFQSATAGSGRSRGKSAGQ